MTPTVSVIVPMHNSPTIAQTLGGLARQTQPATEVLVVGADEQRVVEAGGRVRFVANGRASAARNRNRGMAEAAGDLLCFIDADCVPAVDWLERLTAAFADESVAVVGGGVRFGGGGYWSTCDNISWFYQFLASAAPGQRTHLPTLNLALRRSVVDAVGGIDERFGGAAGEDTDWTERMVAAGFVLHFRPAAAVLHLPTRTTAAALLRHGYCYGRQSTKVGSAARARSRSLRLLPTRRWGILLASPVLAAAATLRVVWQMGARPGMWAAAPGIWLSKMAWSAGAAAALQGSRGDEHHMGGKL